jgi:hypothetical protein
MSTMRSMMASKRRHPSYSYEIPEPRSHVHVIEADEEQDEAEVANVVDLATARARLRPAS